MKSILLVVDVQNDFIDGTLGSKEAVTALPSIINKINTFDGEVIFTRDTHDENYLSTQEGKNLPVKHCIINTDGWQIVKKADEYRIKNNCMVFDKVTFGSSELGPKLVKLNEEEKIDSITVIGLCTDICVISNAMIAKAFLPEVPIIIDAKCCAGVSVETHENALKAMEVCQIKIER